MLIFVPVAQTQNINSQFISQTGAVGSKVVPFDRPVGYKPPKASASLLRTMVAMPRNPAAQARKQKGGEIAKMKGGVRKLPGKEGEWSVASQSISGNRYVVKLIDGSRFECACLDHKNRQCDCKHIWAVKIKTRNG